MVDISVQFPAGSGRDTLSRSGLAGLTLSLLPGGTADLDEEEVSRRLADVGANLGQTFDYDRAGLSLRTLSAEASLTPAVGGPRAAFCSGPASRPPRWSGRRRACWRGCRRPMRSPTGLPAAPSGAWSTAIIPTGCARAGRRSRWRISRARISRSSTPASSTAGTRWWRSWATSPVARAEAIAEQLTAGLPEASEPLPPLPPVAPLDAASTRRIALSFRAGAHLPRRARHDSATIRTISRCWSATTSSAVAASARA